MPTAPSSGTSPSGHTYTTHPGSKLLIPALCLPTAELAPAPADAPGPLRGALMPKRRETREVQRLRRIMAERRPERVAARE